MSGANVLQQIETIRAVQRDIDDKNIGPGGGENKHRTVGILSLAANHQVGLTIHHQRQALAHDRMVIDHEYSLLRSLRLWFESHRHFISLNVFSSIFNIIVIVTYRHSPSGITGNKHVTTVPLRSRRCTSSEPPTIRAR